MSNEDKNFYEFGGFQFDAKLNTLWRAGELIPLSPKSTELLKLLIERNGDVVSKQEIMDVVWANTFVEEGVLTQNIYTLRQILGTDENGNQLIANVPRKGYRLTVSVLQGNSRRSNFVATTEKLPNETPNSISKLLFAGIGILVIAALSSLAYFFIARSSPPSEDSGKVLKFKQLTDTGDAGYLTISADGNFTAYSNNSAIFVKDLRSNTEIEVKLEQAEKPGCLQFSPDGESIYFGTLFTRDEKGSIYRVTKNGGSPEKIADDIWSGFSISPDGDSLSFVRKTPDQNKQDLIIKDLSSKNERRVKTLSLPEEFYWNNYPAWSADGSKLALVIVNQTEHLQRILLIDAASGKETEIKPKQFRNVEQVVWSADGNSLIAAANEGVNFQLWKISIADGSGKRITNDLNSYLGIAISHDRKALVSRQRIYYSNIWISGKDNFQNLKQLTSGSSRNDGLRGLSWLDDERLLYSTNDEKIRDWNLWLLDTADGSKQKLTNDLETQNDSPIASNDKRLVFFASDRNKESRIWQIGIDGTNPKQVTFGEDETHHFPQVSADGKWLYFIIKSGRNSTIGRKSLIDNSVQEISGKTSYIPGNFLQLSRDGRFLAFQNIAYKIENPVNGAGYQIAIMPTDDPDSTTLKTINAWQKSFIWGADNNSFYYIGGDVKEASILGQKLDEVKDPFPIVPPGETNFFSFAFSPSGEKLAVARGRLLRDVVLLTDFE